MSLSAHKLNNISSFCRRGTNINKQTKQSGAIRRILIGLVYMSYSLNSLEDVVQDDTRNCLFCNACSFFLLISYVLTFISHIHNTFHRSMGRVIVAFFLVYWRIFFSLQLLPMGESSIDPAVQQ